MTDHLESSDSQPQSNAQKLTARDLVLLLPNFAKLLWRLARDRRVPLATWLLLLGTAAYLAMPFDLIPDWLPGIGYLDDAFVVAFTLRRIIRSVPGEALREHWDGAVPLEDLARRLSFGKKRPRAGEQPGGRSPQ